MDFTNELTTFLTLNKREFDGKLHSSNALTDNMRHVQLGLINMEQKDEDLMSLVRMNTGTLWHAWLDKMFTERGDANVLTEVKLDKYMHPEWSGTLDMLYRGHDDPEWTIWDYKVVNPMSLPWVQKSGGKVDHKWQVSHYYYSAKELLAEEYGEPLSPELRVVYIPAFTDNKVMAPFVSVFLPIEKELFDAELEARTNRAVAYRDRHTDTMDVFNGLLVKPDLYEYKERKGKVLRVPHWRSKFCPYVGITRGGRDVCGCHKLKQKTLGKTEDWGHLL